MIAETGLFALILAFFAASLGGVLPLAGMSRKDVAWLKITPRAALAVGGLVTFSFLALIVLHVGSDFSVRNVAENSHTDKPLLFRLAGAWGSHEGSLLLWVFVLAFYGMVAALGGRRLPRPMHALTLGVQSGLTALFLLYLLLASNPFARLFPVPINGAGLNPLLQDVGLALHPPLLYLGYVGFSLCFSAACGALFLGRLGPEVARFIRRWALVAWCFLTLGIGFGAWWSYYTLGWGGWWAWDPVENAALLPWLAGTALVHCATITARRGVLQGCTALLAILTFTLSLIGTFLVRSGVITSVHAFAADPARGTIILILIGLCSGGALSLFAARGGRLSSTTLLAPFTQEGASLSGALVLLVLAGSVLIGTLYPMVLDALDVGQISVGPPYYNLVAGGLALPLLSLMMVAPLLARRLPVASVIRQLSGYLAAGLVAAVAEWWAEGAFSLLSPMCGMAVALLASLIRVRRVSLYLAHGGLAALILGIVISGGFSQETEVLLHPGAAIHFAGRQIIFQNVQQTQVSNYDALRARVLVDGAAMQPEQRQYRHPPQMKAVPAIRTSWRGDLYIVFSGLEDGGARFHLFQRPMQVLIFIAMALMAMGGLLALVGTFFWGGGNCADDPAPVRNGSRRRLGAVVPVVFFAALTGVLFWRLNPAPTPPAPSPLVGKAVPSLALRPLAGMPPVLPAAFAGRPYLINVFASWCAPCRAEAPVLRFAAQQGLAVIGIAYHDKAAAVQAFLQENGNPYAQVGLDDGTAALAFGLTGVPETLLIDGHGNVLWHTRGPVDEDMVRKQILPLTGPH